MKKEKPVFKQQFNAFMQEIAQLNLSKQSSVLLDKIIVLGSGNIFTDKVLAEKTNLTVVQISKAKKTLINLGIITCNQAWMKKKRVGTCITVNYDFKNGAINTDNILSLLATIDNKAPGLSLQAKGLLTHFVAKSIACQKDSFMITERQEGNELALNIKTFLKYKKELSDLGIITCNHQHNGTVIKINFNWEGELLKTETNNTEVHTITEEFNLISPEQLAESMGVTVPTVKGWVRKGQFPSYDHVFGRKKFWKSETVRNRIYRA